MIHDCDMISTMEAKHPNMSVNSTKTRSKTIDHILIPNGSENAIAKSRQLPFNLGFDTNHRAVYADMRAANLLHLQMKEPVQRGSR